jgi:hypothetical protein
MGHGHVNKTHTLDARHAVIDLGLDMLEGVPPTSPPHKNFHCFCYIVFSFAVAKAGDLTYLLRRSFFTCSM